MDGALRDAIEARDFWACRALLLRQAAASRAAIGLPARSGLSALQLAALCDDEAAQALLARGAPCDLHSACALGLAADIERLAEAPANGTARSALAALAENLTPMGFALARGRLAGVQALLRVGDDAERRLPRIGFFSWELAALAAGHGDWRPLHAACAHGYADDAAGIVAALLDAGADIEAPCPPGDRPLHLAATYGWLPVMETLLARGAQLESRTAPTAAAVWELSSPKDAPPAFGQTPLAVAAREGRIDACRALLRHGADPNARDASHATALHFAARPWWRENPPVVELLLAAGADRSARDQDGQRPADLAAAAGHGETAALLAGP